MKSLWEHLLRWVKRGFFHLLVVEETTSHVVPLKYEMLVVGERMKDEEFVIDDIWATTSEFFGGNEH